jgi:hypothetical protein
VRLENVTLPCRPPFPLLPPAFLLSCADARQRSKHGSGGQLQQGADWRDAWRRPTLHPDGQRRPEPPHPARQRRPDPLSAALTIRWIPTVGASAAVSNNPISRGRNASTHPYIPTAGARPLPSADDGGHPPLNPLASGGQRRTVGAHNPLFFSITPVWVPFT